MSISFQYFSMMVNIFQTTYMVMEKHQETNITVNKLFSFLVLYFVAMVCRVNKSFWSSTKLLRLYTERLIFEHTKEARKSMENGRTLNLDNSICTLSTKTFYETVALIFCSYYSLVCRYFKLLYSNFCQSSLQQIG